MRCHQSKAHPLTFHQTRANDRHLLPVQRSRERRRAQAGHCQEADGGGRGYCRRVGVPLRVAGERWRVVVAVAVVVVAVARRVGCALAAVFMPSAPTRLSLAILTPTHNQPNPHSNPLPTPSHNTIIIINSTATPPTRRRGSSTASWATKRWRWRRPGRPTSTAGPPTAAG